ncbi:MAG: addiction module toxin, HicA family [Deltaproteobacteria bacterium]|nr:addiction module toxin, HicA family [Deltaproteobacteria bacterium]
MKAKELLKKLKRAGATVIPQRGKGSHCLVKFQGRSATVPFHGDTDIGSHLIKKICQQLGLDSKNIL